MGVFRPKRVLPGLEWLTGDVLEAFHQIAVGYGSQVEGTAVRFLSAEPEMSITASSDPQDRMMIVIGPGGQTEKGTRIIPLAPVPGFEAAVVIWDGRVTQIAAERLLEKARTGTFVPSSGSSKLSVDATFDRPGTAIGILSGQDAEGMRRMFDRPEEVTVVRGPMGTVALCRVRDVALVEKRNTASAKFLGERGLSLERIGDLSWDDVRTLRAEIAKVAES